MIFERECEAQRVYRCGIKVYISRQQKKLNLPSSIQEKLFDMLLEHHRSQVKKITESEDKLQAQLIQLDNMIEKYNRSCFEFDSSVNQHDLDLI